MRSTVRRDRLLIGAVLTVVSLWGSWFGATVEPEISLWKWDRFEARSEYEDLVDRYTITHRSADILPFDEWYDVAPQPLIRSFAPNLVFVLGHLVVIVALVVRLWGKTRGRWSRRLTVANLGALGIVAMAALWFVSHAPTAYPELRMRFGFPVFCVAAALLALHLAEMRAEARDPRLPEPTNE